MFSKKKRMFEPVGLSKRQLAAAFRVQEEHPLLQGVLHVLKAQEEEFLSLIVPGQPELARRDVSTGLRVVRDLRDDLLGLVEKSNESAKSAGGDDDE